MLSNESFKKPSFLSQGKENLSAFLSINTEQTQEHENNDYDDGVVRVCLRDLHHKNHLKYTFTNIPYGSSMFVLKEKMIFFFFSFCKFEKLCAFFGSLMSVGDLWCFPEKGLKEDVLSLLVLCQKKTLEFMVSIAKKVYSFLS